MNTSALKYPPEARVQSQSLLLFDTIGSQWLQLVLAGLSLDRYALTVVDSTEQARDLLEHGDFDVCLAAWDDNHADLHGLVEVASRGDWYIPVVVAYSSLVSQPLEDLMACGASDVMDVEDISNAGIERLLNNAAMRGRQMRKLVSNAAIDQLTGLFSRRYIETHLDRLMSGRRREEIHASLIFIDLDQFHRINDERGANAGDELLRVVANAIGKSVRELDIASRWGGDEFAVVVNSTNPEDNLKIGERLIGAIRSTCANDSEFVSASIGIAPLEPTTETVEQWVAKAAGSMQAAKSAGGARVTLHAA